MLLEQLQKEAQRRGLSPRTVSTYAYCVQKFLNTISINKEDVKQYLDRFLDCPNTLNVNLNAIKFFFEQVLHRKLTLNIQFSKTRKTLPEFLTQEETVNFLSTITNPKHRLMIELMYGAGLRVSELVNLKVKDLELEHNYGWVRQGKGRKDRLFILPLFLKEKLIKWIEEQKLSIDSWLFPGLCADHYSVSSIQAIVKQAKKDAGLKKNVHPHTLRHSFATHLIQNGYAVTELQPLLGHSRLETTMIYVHMACSNMLNVKSPLDGLTMGIKNG